MSFASFMLCRLFNNSDNKRDAGLSTPADVLRYDNILYGTDRRWQVLDVYRPKEVRGKLPVIISAHGGGWVYGDKDRYQFYCMDLARRGFAVVNFTYHLAPKYKFPQPLKDTVQVFQWVLDHADQYDLDTQHIFAVGDSAGGQLLALYCILCTDPEYASQFEFSVNPDTRPKAVALNCGAFDVTHGNHMNNSLMKDYLPKGGNSDERRMVSPLLHVTAAFPPAYIATAVKDFLREDSLTLHNRLDALGVTNSYRMYDNSDHSLGHVFHLDIRSSEAKNCNDEECDFFREYLKS